MASSSDSMDNTFRARVQKIFGSLSSSSSSSLSPPWKTNSIEHAHVRNVDYDTKKKFILVTAEDESGIHIWDLRMLKVPILELPGHAHWCS
ncbi:WD repeat-containing protein DWA2 [Camellia lanceoleosa]|uniref:WD repeat-containing protein DWA2 n=1 Tax=Camellia lanceoleosa TaxID=1840588 RepID=A0ACC0FQX4_9ERIC|nr:WD repeat-containing protein DWA2 [Camellia lanceoleosa]